MVVWLVVMATSPWSWAGGVQPEGEPRFGVEGERHRVVLPLSAVPSGQPTVDSEASTVNVGVPGLHGDATATYLPDILSESAGGIRDVVVRPGGISIRTTRQVVFAKAFLLQQPARLVVDAVLAASSTTPGARPADVPVKPHAKKSPPAAAPKPARAAQAKAPAAPPVSPRKLADGGERRTEVGSAAELSPASARRAEDERENIGNAGKGSALTSLPNQEPVHAQGARHEGAQQPAGAEKAGTAQTQPASVANARAPEVSLPRRTDNREERGGETPATSDVEETDAEVPEPSGYHLDYVDGRPFIWPDLDASFYTQADTAAGTMQFVMPRAQAMARLRTAPNGATPVLAPATAPIDLGPAAPAGDLLPAHAPAAAHFLEADLAYLHAPAGESLFRARSLYQRAARVAPRFPDRRRAELMIGFTEIELGLAAEAEGSFVRVAHRAATASIVGLGYLGAAWAGRASGHADRAAEHLRHAITAAPRDEAGCYARGDLALIFAESRRGKEAVELFDEVRETCPGALVRSPRMLLKHAAVLATAGRMEDAEELVLALPEFEGELFVRQKLLEGDLAVAMRNPEFARRAYEAARTAVGVAPAVKTEATLRLARVEDAAGRHERAGELLTEIAVGEQRPAERARAVALAAELLARRGRYAESFHLLETADRLGPPGFALAESVRAQSFRAWMDDLTERGDDAGMLAMFYRYRSDGVGAHLEPRDVVRVGEAAARLGLPELVVPIVSTVDGQVRGATRARASRLLAEAALAEGEGAEALRATGEMARAGDAAEQAAVDRIRGHALLQLGRIDEAAQVLRPEGEREDLLALGRAYLRDQKDVAKAQSVLAPVLSGGGEDEQPATLEAWLALADAAEAAGDRALAAAALRAAIERFPGKAVRGVHYRLARLESADADPSRAAETYATAAQRERDPLLARAARADAAYYRAMQQYEGRP